MIDKAIEKINAEMQKNPSSRNMEIIGHYLIDRCDEALATKITGGKTLKGAMAAVVKKAQGAKKGNEATLTFDEVFGEVDKYFGIPTDAAAQWRAIGLPSAAAQWLAMGRPPTAAPVGEPPQRPVGDIDPLDYL